MLTYVVFLVLGLAGGGTIVFIALDTKRRSLDQQKQEQDKRVEQIKRTIHELNTKQEERNRANKAQEQFIISETQRRLQEIDADATRRLQEIEAREQAGLKELETRSYDLNKRVARISAQEAELAKRLISYDEIRKENQILKQDLLNLDIGMRKIEIDRDLQRKGQEELDERSTQLAMRYLKESIKWITSSLTANNFVTCKQRLQAVLEWCRSVGYRITKEEEDSLLADLKLEFEKIVRFTLEREEQARIKARIREEELLQREVERELKQLERERAAIQAALAKALAETQDQHSAEVESLKARLADAEAKAQRAISQAQMTKAGYIYVISNIGSFGQDVYKVGMTRRLEPQDRIRELGDASVPFPFDVHMMISCQDAPTLENVLHRKLHKARLNRVNPRKEFFKISLEAIREIVEKHHGEVQYAADPAALEYNQSLIASEEDEEYIEEVFHRAARDTEPLEDD